MICCLTSKLLRGNITDDFLKISEYIGPNLVLKWEIRDALLSGCTPLLNDLSLSGGESQLAGQIIHFRLFVCWPRLRSSLILMGQRLWPALRWDSPNFRRVETSTHPPPPPTTVDHQQTSFAFETAHHSGSKDFGVQRLGLLISRFMDRQRENLLGPRPSTRFGNKHTIQRRNCRVSNLEFHKRHLINSKITLFSARVPLSTGVLRLQGLKTWVSSPDTQKQRG